MSKRGSKIYLKVVNIVFGGVGGGAFCYTVQLKNVKKRRGGWWVVMGGGLFAIPSN